MQHLFLLSLILTSKKNKSIERLIVYSQPRSPSPISKWQDTNQIKLRKRDRPRALILTSDSRCEKG